MKPILSVIFLLLSFSIVAQTTHILIYAEPDVDVYLDKTFKGRTSADLGELLIKDVSPGKHKINLIKEGFYAQEESIVVKEKEVFKYTAKTFTPLVNISQQSISRQKAVASELGAISIQSSPVQIQIEIKALGIKSLKEEDVWTKSEIPAGNYNVTFQWKSNVLDTTLTVKQSTLTSIFIDMNKMKLERIEYKSDTVLHDSLLINKNTGHNNKSKLPPEDYRNDIFIYVESTPEFPGGSAKMMEYITKNLVYPSEAKKNKIEGRVFVSFIVEKDGSITNVKVLRGLGSGCDEEAIRIVEKMPNWTPGSNSGKPINVKFTLPIRFSL